MASPVNLPTESRDSPRTGLASSLSTQKSYGTVKNPSPIFNHAPWTASTTAGSGYITHELEEEDTIQGLALCYNVTIDQIQRLNHLWSSESIHSRTRIKIPIESTSSNLTQSNMAETTRRSSTSALSKLHSGSNGSSIIDSTDSSNIADDEVVRSKPHNYRQGQRSASTSVAYGEKNISEILRTADEQLRKSKQFVEKLALKNAAVKMPADAYNRERKDRWDESLHSKPRQARTVEQSTERMSASREEIENNLFEL